MWFQPDVSFNWFSYWCLRKGILQGKSQISLKFKPLDSRVVMQFFLALLLHNQLHINEGFYVFVKDKYFRYLKWLLCGSNYQCLYISRAISALKIASGFCFLGLREETRVYFSNTSSLLVGYLITYHRKMWCLENTEILSLLLAMWAERNKSKWKARKIAILKQKYSS